MIDKTTDFFDGAAKTAGVPVSLPRPGKKARMAAAATNGALGIGLLVLGAIISSKAVAGLGALGLAGAALLAAKK